MVHFVKWEELIDAYQDLEHGTQKQKKLKLFNTFNEEISRIIFSSSRDDTVFIQLA